MTVAVTLEVDLATVTDATGIAPRTVVAIPPSDADPSPDEMQIDVAGRRISRAYDSAVTA